MDFGGVVASAVDSLDKLSMTDAARRVDQFQGLRSGGLRSIRRFLRPGDGGGSHCSASSPAPRPGTIRGTPKRPVDRIGVRPRRCACRKPRPSWPWPLDHRDEIRGGNELSGPNASGIHADNCARTTRCAVSTGLPRRYQRAGVAPPSTDERPRQRHRDPRAPAPDHGPRTTPAWREDPKHAA
jgi:hypothetical protein